MSNASEYRCMLGCGAKLIIESSEFSASELRTLGAAAKQGSGKLYVIDVGDKSSSELRTIACSGAMVICDPKHRSSSDIRTIAANQR